MSKTIASILDDNPVIPVVTPLSVESTVKVAHALVNGGINSIEITLRTKCAIDAIKAVKASGIPITLGVGTIIDGNMIRKLKDIGVDFGVSPGLTDDMLRTAKDIEFNLLPGIATPSELIQGLGYGLNCFKLFPANAINSHALLKAFNATFPGIKFCPTGGVNPENIESFLSQPNVAAVGGSWLVTKDDINNKQYKTITEKCRAIREFLNGG